MSQTFNIIKTDDTAKTEEFYSLPALSSQAGKVLAVNGTEDGYEYVTVSAANIGNSDLTSTDNTRTFRTNGNTSSNIFRVGNLTGSKYLLSLYGDGTWGIGNNSSADGRIVGSSSGTLSITAGHGTGERGKLVWNMGSTQTQFSSKNWVDWAVTANGQYVRVLTYDNSAVGSYTYIGYLGGLHLASSATSHGGGGSKHYIVIENGMTPTADRTDKMIIYSSDNTSGFATFTTRNENGDTVQLYTETTGIGGATFVANTSGISDDTATFDGYTIGQVVSALRRMGILA